MNARDNAWAHFDQIVTSPVTNPWVGRAHGRRFDPDFDVLRRLLSVPVELGLASNTGLPAKAVDVWLSRELRRAGFDPDAVWPRASDPRVVPREVALLVAKLPTKLREQVETRLTEGRAGPAVSADASVLGKAYFKQVDVVIAEWARGPELMISTKRMDSSLSNNASNRIEESYGDAHNLRGRHPLAAIGYVMVVRASALDAAPRTADRLIDLVGKLARDESGYTATCVLVADWIDANGPAEVTLHEDRVPEPLRAAPFLQTMVETVLLNTPVTTHEEARRRMRGDDLADLANDIV